MGLLDSVLGSVMGNMAGGRQRDGAGADILMQVVGGLLNQGGGGAGGGLGALLEQFQKGGLGDVAASWVGTGQNLPISAEQLQSVLGGDQIGALAQQAGLSQGDLMGQLAQMLPQVVDRLTPNGQLPAGGEADLSGMLSSVLGGLMRR